MINLSMAEPDNMLRPRITVIGVGGGGGNAINNMIRSNLDGCDFVVANTDSQALAQSLAARKIQLGSTLSRGLGAGSKPDIGCAAAEESLPDIMSILDGSDMLFVTAGMGGGTGTGAAPVIARAARETGILTVGVVTKPFHFEGTQRMRQAERGIAELQQYVDTLIVIPNQNLFRIANERTTFAEAFRMADEVLHSGVRGITDLMVMPGFMNLDFADVKTVMGEMGKAMMGTGEAEGDNRAIRAAEAAISNPLLDDISMKGARGVLINITGGMDMTLFEVDQAANRIREEVDPEAQIKVGSTLGDGLEGRIRVSVIATGIDVEKEMAQQAKRSTTGGYAPSEATQQARAAAPVRAAPAAVQESRPAATVSPIRAPEVKTQAQPQATAVRETPAVNVSSQSYFTMSSTVSPRMVAQPVASPVMPRAAIEVPAEEPENMVTEQAEVAQQHQARVVETQTETPVVHQAQIHEESDEEVVEQSSMVAKAPAQRMMNTAPVREIPPVQQAQRQRTAPAGSRADSASDMRVTQLTTPATQQASASIPINQRAQSLFQRITGFGMIRPSASREIEEEMDMETTVPSAREDVVKTEPSIERSGLSSSESDLLDIPAFLRRQSNH